MSFFKRFVNSVLCAVQGHPALPTGRHGGVLTEWRCQRCNGLYVSSKEYGNALINADDHSDRIFTDYMAELAKQEGTCGWMVGGHSRTNELDPSEVVQGHLCGAPAITSMEGFPVCQEHADMWPSRVREQGG